MSARFWATFGLLTSSFPVLLTSSVPLRAASLPSAEPSQISLRLRTGLLPLGAAEEMRRELSALMDAAGVAAHWDDAASYGQASGLTVLVDIEGNCSLPFHSEPAPLAEGTPLASTATAESYVLPFITLKCGALSALMAPLTSNHPESFRDFAVGRALGRVLAHELYHVVTRSENHPDAGLAKAHLSAADLMKPRLDFDETALNRLRASIHPESMTSPDELGRESGSSGEPEGK